MPKDGLSRPPFVMMFFKDWLAKTMGMTVEEEGCYIRLLAVARTQSDDWCSLPNDDKVLARICNISTRKWKRVRCRLIPSCLAVEGDRLVSDRLRQEAEIQHAKREQARLAGLESAHVRAQRTFNDR
jgi:uncharacterized protein YdaU (DUF1376 family)